jgi:hypothetical protein
MGMELMNKQILKDPKTGRIFRLPKELPERVHTYTVRNLQIKNTRTGEIHDLPESGIPIFIGGKYPTPEGEFPRVYVIAINDGEKSAAGIIKHNGSWSIYPFKKNIYLDGEEIDEIKSLDKEFSKITYCGNELRVLYKHSIKPRN